MTVPTNITEFAQQQLEILDAREAALALERASLVDNQIYWEAIGGQQGAVYAARAAAGVARIDLELARLAQQEASYSKVLETGVLSLGRRNAADEWVP
jgi:hypothetical protein